MSPTAARPLPTTRVALARNTRSIARANTVAAATPYLLAATFEQRQHPTLEAIPQICHPWTAHTYRVAWNIVSGSRKVIVRTMVASRQGREGASRMSDEYFDGRSTVRGPATNWLRGAPMEVRSNVKLTDLPPLKHVLRDVLWSA